MAADSTVGLELFKVAEQRAAGGELDVAARFAERARDVFVDAAELDAACAAASLQGRIRLRAGDVSTAEECFTWVTEQAREAKLPERELAAMTELGALYEVTGNVPGALACHESVLQRYRDGGNQLGTANALGNVGRLLTRLGEADRAAEMLREALATFEAAGEPAGMVNSMICLGDLARMQGELSVAFAAFNDAVARCSEGPIRQLRTVALLNLGHVLREMGQREDALATIEESRDLARELGDVQGIARARLGEAMARADSRAPKESIAAFEEAEAAFMQIGQPPAALAATVNRAAVLCRIGELREGRDALIHARQVLRGVGDDRGAVEVGLALCEVLIALGQVGESTALLNTLACTEHGPRLALRAGMLNARLAMRTGALADAAQLLRTGEIAELSVPEAFAVRLMGAEIATVSGDFDGADSVLDDLLAGLDPMGSPREHAAARMGKAGLAMWRGDLVQAGVRYSDASRAWLELGESIPHLQCTLATLRVDALTGEDPTQAAHDVLAKLRETQSADATDSATACCAALTIKHERATLADKTEDDDDADAILIALKPLLDRGNKLAVIAELAFAATLLGDAALFEEVDALLAKTGIARPGFLPPSPD